MMLCIMLWQNLIGSVPCKKKKTFVLLVVVTQPKVTFTPKCISNVLSILLAPMTEPADCSGCTMVANVRAVFMQKIHKMVKNVLQLEHRIVYFTISQLDGRNFIEIN